MSDELSDREIHQALEKIALDCPNCGGQFILEFPSGTLSVPEKLVLIQLSLARYLRLVPIEDEAEILRRTGVIEGARGVLS